MHTVMFSKYITLFVLGFATVSQSQTGLKCWQCSNAKSNDDCMTDGSVVTCSSDQGCHNEVGHENGLLTVNKGCQTQTKCMSQAGTSPNYWQMHCQLENVIPASITCHCCCFSDQCNEEAIWCKKDTSHSQIADEEKEERTMDTSITWDEPWKNALMDPESNEYAEKYAETKAAYEAILERAEDIKLKAIESITFTKGSVNAKVTSKVEIPEGSSEKFLTESMETALQKLNDEGTFPGLSNNIEVASRKTYDETATVYKSKEDYSSSSSTEQEKYLSVPENEAKDEPSSNMGQSGQLITQREQPDIEEIPHFSDNEAKQKSSSNVGQSELHWEERILEMTLYTTATWDSRLEDETSVAYAVMVKRISPVFGDIVENSKVMHLLSTGSFHFHEGSIESRGSKISADSKTTDFMILESVVDAMEQLGKNADGMGIEHYVDIYTYKEEPSAANHEKAIVEESKQPYPTSSTEEHVLASDLANEVKEEPSSNMATVQGSTISTTPRSHVSDLENKAKEEPASNIGSSEWEERILEMTLYTTATWNPILEDESSRAYAYMVQKISPIFGDIVENSKVMHLLSTGSFHFHEGSIESRGSKISADSKTTDFMILESVVDAMEQLGKNADDMGIEHFVDIYTYKEE